MIDWENALKEQTKENLLDCEKNLTSKEYHTKIEKWCRKFGFDFDTIFAKAKNDYYFRAFFAKDPKKQNIYEIGLERALEILREPKKPRGLVKKKKEE